MAPEQYHAGIGRIASALAMVALSLAVRSSAASVSIKITSLGHFCYSARASDGWYTAGHCTKYRGGIVSFGGSRIVPPYSVDQSRDLAHFAGPPADVTLRPPAAGEVATVTMDGRGTLHYVFQRIVDGRVFTSDRTPGDYQLWCLDPRPGDRVTSAGDSGAGLHLQPNEVAPGGAGLMLADPSGSVVLSGIITNGGPVPPQVCASGYGALAVSVP